MIRKLSHIRKMAVFDAFDWDASVRDANNRPIFFKPLNVIYGRNYSGKTTLSRILHALENGEISDKYTEPEFTVEFTDGSTVDQTSPTSHAHTVRVFNEDFVRSHLRSFFDDEQGIIAPFAVLGDENAELTAKLEAKEAELGSEQTPGSLLAVEAERQTASTAAQRAYQGAHDALEGQLRDKANTPRHGIKHNKVYGNANYDIRAIKKDIEAVRTKSYVSPTDKEVDALKALLDETTKPDIPESPALSLQYASIAKEAQALIERKIGVSEPIQDLLDNTLLQEWVRDGRKLHEGKRKTCGFCGNDLPAELWANLDKHFNEESEKLREEISALQRRIDEERGEALLSFDSGSFYSAYSEQAKALETKAKVAVDAYKKSLDAWRNALTERHKDIFKPGSILDVKDSSATLESLRTEYEQLRETANEYTTSLKAKQDDARVSLRRHTVAEFVLSIKYDDQTAKIAELEAEATKKKEELAAASTKVTQARQAAAALKAQMTDERNGAERVNGFLSHDFGHPSLSLVVLETEAEEGKQCRFEIHRDGARAYHLSEGERGLIAFCYFVARLDDVETSGTKPIIWIDDPASSLDDNHIFFIFGLMKSRIVQKEAFSQLFVSTHNLTLLKYLRRLSKHPNSRNKEHFLIQRQGKRSTIRRMPTHMAQFATEFHYLFHQIQQCAVADDGNEEDVDLYYSLGNNMRKFLEMYLFFKYPDGEEKLEAKLERFFGEDPVAARVTDRICNEYSHLRGLFERGTMPVDVPAMKQMAGFVLERIKESDPEQYASLLTSIGEPPEEKEVGNGK